AKLRYLCLETGGHDGRPATHSGAPPKRSGRMPTRKTKEKRASAGKKQSNPGKSRKTGRCWDHEGSPLSQLAI
ncbi:hypothetical protein Tco_0166961, partial [Tanacetum coccineum]